ncbi:Signal transduction histidine kinase [Marinobacter daqiaonensis]|uniref:histidine kinase n=1 Tax=Marinobacter daqiaonensis TaxID=650891 RepID=A0A1I6H2D4_9GAMM|nr:ATP-binding protein [Marinobacter daqiaonensis]SFR48570.1 Signal transduction histidine kinase [Marinobacter daqiaonensis]
MKQLFRNRLSYRLTRNTVLLAMAVGLVLNLIQVTVEYHATRAFMDQDVKALMEISHSPASQIAYNIDTRLANELLEGMLHHPAVIDARILDPEQRTLAAASRGSGDTRYRWLSNLLFGETRRYSLPLEVSDLREIELGHLVVTVSTTHYGNIFLSRASFILISGILKSLALSLLLLVVFYLVLTKPMLRVIKSLQEVKDAPEKARLPVPGSHERDEIGSMVAIINHHLETVDASLSQLRAVESQMKDYSGQLEREVEDRTREISEKNQALQRSNRALVRAKEDAVRRAQTRARFLASMSHEIRTPLNGVLGMLELALEGDLQPAQRHQLEIAQGAGQGLLNLLNDILDISKVEAGKLDLEVISFDLRKLVQECATIHYEQARRKGLEFETRLESDLASRYLGDPTRIRQVINNLLANAIKFTESGRVSIHLAQTPEGVRLEVRDTGIGMSREALHRIFSPFSQADSDTTRRYGGTGLGLALCQQLVERMHGQIQVDSRAGQGTWFTVSLPLPEDRSVPAGDPLDMKQATNSHPNGLQGCRILLVEDNRVNQIVASGLLQKMGHEVDHADNGERALSALSLKPYDLVLMDCQMPVMDGYEATRRIREKAEWRDLPVVAVTANVMSGDRDACLAAGMNDYITKPYNRRVLEDVIRRWVSCAPPG